MIRIIIPLIPVGQRRARSTVLNGHARTYKSTEQRAAEEAVLYYLEGMRPPQPLEGPLELFVVAVLPCPPSWPAKRARGAIAGEILPTVKPDLDNMAKHILDCMGPRKQKDGSCRPGYFLDDKQVCRMVIEKRYGTDPRWEVVLGSIKTGCGPGPAPKEQGE